METVKTVKGYAIERRIGTRGFFTVTIERTEHITKQITFRTIKAAAEWIEKNL